MVRRVWSPASARRRAPGPKAELLTVKPSENRCAFLGGERFQPWHRHATPPHTHEGIERDHPIVKRVGLSTSSSRALDTTASTP
jgi:hypothetical protein